MTITEEAKAWEGFVARSVNCKEANNPNQFFITGTTLLSKDAFDKINDTEHDVVHGVQVIYGPFGSVRDVENFVADYSGSEYFWPGHHDWKYVNAGRPYILSPLVGPEGSKIVHNSSLEFQGQLEMNEQQRRIKEIEDMKRKLREREKNNNKPIEKDELEVRIQWLTSDVDRRRTELEQEQSHLSKLLAMREKLNNPSDSA